MVGVAQLVEHLVVVQDVAGSSPVTHPKISPGRPVERKRQDVAGSSPVTHPKFATTH
jgi:hypothetical protein